jgi:hypothetical protein
LDSQYIGAFNQNIFQFLPWYKNTLGCLTLKKQSLVRRAGDVIKGNGAGGTHVSPCYFYAI